MTKTTKKIGLIPIVCALAIVSVPIVSPPLMRHISLFMTGLFTPDPPPDVEQPSAEEIIRANILKEARKFIGLMEKGGDNQGPEIAKFLRSSQYSRSTKGKAAPLGSAWCAGYTSNILTKIIPGTYNYSVLAKGLMNQTKSESAFYEIGGSYTPQPADLVFFERGADGDWKGHVAFVEEVKEDGSLVLIEANKSHPDYRGMTDYAWDADKPDGVRRVTYAPSEFAESRILGFGNIMQMVQKRSADHIMRNTLPKPKPPIPKV